MKKITSLYFNYYSRLIFLLGICLITGLWLFIFYQINYDYDRTIEENSRETMNLAKVFEEHVRRIIVEADKDLLDLKSVYEQEGEASPMFVAYVENLIKDSSRTQIAIYDEKGNIVKSFIHNYSTETNRADREYFRFHLKDDCKELYIGKPITGRTTGKRIIPLSRRINKPDNSFGGIVYIGLSTDYFLSYYNKINLGNNQLISLIGTDGFIRARQVNNQLESGRNITSSKVWKHFMAGHLNDTYIDISSSDAVSRITSYRVMPDYPLIVIVSKSTEVAFSNFEKRKQAFIGGAFFVSLWILSFCFLLIHRYVKQEAMNKEISKLERLNLVGEMAAGMAHEIRNPLTTVRGYLQWYLAKGKYPELNTKFSTMIEELDRANAIITEYLSLAKNKPIELKMDNINSVIDALAPLLQAEAYNLGHSLQILTGKIPDILIDSKELRQMILNFAQNGFEAMPASGILSIQTYVRKNKVILSIGDTGGGISQAVLEKIGTPFMTTKSNGTGLGVAVCYQIAARHKAKISIETSPKGTVFFVTFDIKS